MFRMAVCALVTALSLAGASIAHAAIIVIETGGVVRQGYDAQNIFGLGYDLTGQSFTAKFIVDSSKGDVVAGDTEFYSYGTPSAGTAIFSMNGVDIDLNASLLAMMGAAAYTHMAQEDITGTTVFNRVLWASRPLGSGTIFDQDSIDPCGAGLCFGTFELSESDLGTGVSTIHVDLALAPSYYRASVVPEPGVWAMMIVGFGLSGSALRRARRVRPILA